MTGRPVIPGEVLVGAEAVPLNADRPAITLLVVNTGDRPVQVGSHYHFAQANPALDFDRGAARGHRLDIPAGTAVRFEPGLAREVSLVPLAGRRVVPGLRPGDLSGAARDTSRGSPDNPDDPGNPGEPPADLPGAARDTSRGSPDNPGNPGEPPVDLPGAARDTSRGSPDKRGNADDAGKPVGVAGVREIGRERYALLYGPTTGDQIRLADTDLLIEVEDDLARGPMAGDEAVFGGGKVIRESMGQATATRAEGTPDLVITGAVVLDHWGVVKADVGIRDGRIVALGKAGNPDTMSGVHPALVIGPSTEILAGNGRILTAGTVDCHVHLICPQLIDEALAAGTTTLIGGGTGPAEGTKATTVTPGAWQLARMLEATADLPVNVALLGKGNTVSEAALWEQLRAGAAGFKLHEDWGSTPAAIDACLRVCDAAGVQAALHSDTLNEAGYVQDTLAAIAGRTIHAYHTEGAGGGHAPDIITVASHPNVLPSSTNPTRPYTVNTIDEHLDMLMVCHHLNPAVPEDLAFAESRIRPSTIAAEDVLHDLGAISMIGSDSQAMGRIGEVTLRTWQTAHAMKRSRGALPGDGAADNRRARRYVAKHTICPAVAHGLDAEVGSVEVGKLADLVLWEPAFFGVRPHVVLKGGMVAYGAMGDANASIPTPQPVLPRPMWGAAPRVAAATSVTFVAPAALEDGLAGRLGLPRALVPVADVRTRGKANLPENAALPRIEVDPDTFTVRIDGDVVDSEPATELPMAQRYFLF